MWSIVCECAVGSDRYCCVSVAVPNCGKGGSRTRESKQILLPPFFFLNAPFKNNYPTDNQGFMSDMTTSILLKLSYLQEHAFQESNCSKIAPASAQLTLSNWTLRYTQFGNALPKQTHARVTHGLPKEDILPTEIAKKCWANRHAITAAL